MSVEDVRVRRLAKDLADVSRITRSLAKTQQVARTIIQTDEASLTVPQLVEQSTDVAEVVAEHDETINQVNESTALEFDAWFENQSALLDNEEDSHEAYMSAIDTSERLESARVEIAAAQAELDQKFQDADVRIEKNRTDLVTAKDRIDETFGVATDAKEIAEQAVISVVEEFATSTDATSAPVTGWSTTPPAPEPGVWVWRRTVEELGDGSRRIGLPVMSTGPEGLQGPAGADAALLRISSSRGTSFKNNAISTVLTVTVFSGAKQIVNIEGLRAEFGQGAYLEWWWRREDDSEFGLISSSDDRLSQSGFALTVSPDDVDEQTIFQCIMHT